MKTFLKSFGIAVLLGVLGLFALAMSNQRDELVKLRAVTRADAQMNVDLSRLRGKYQKLDAELSRILGEYRQLDMEFARTCTESDRIQRMR